MSTSPTDSAIDQHSIGRRGFLRSIGPAGLAVAVAGCSKAADETGPSSDAGSSAVIDRLALRQAVIGRALVIYDEIADRLLDRGAQLPIEALAGAAKIVDGAGSTLQKIEEEIIFPRVASTAPGGLIATLRCQHTVGARMTAEIVRIACAGGMSSGGEKEAAALLLRSYTRMYRPHLAREGTIIYPLLSRLGAADADLSRREMSRLEEQERKGGKGVDSMIAIADAVERMLGIGDLAMYTAGDCE